MSGKETEEEGEHGTQSDEDVVEFLAPKKIEKENNECTYTRTSSDDGVAEQSAESKLSTNHDSKKFSCASLLENIVRPRDVISIVNIQEEALGKIKNSTRYLEQFNVRSESLLQQDDVGPKLQKQIEQLTLLTWQMQNITQRVQRLTEKVDSELRLNES
mmetsp:Transcript_12628/g.15676  ORF Transcript_12628/g.15676 Transcript_12628/m.15676 type:complete len:159 (+) Transcript_12628:385-861(+)|eukprot:CAMPEP_0204837390 /NCGR_PEP_ID=MMETSP1346-20131115/27620_1 /ASSEMBLY_ACC=CAM_ASM_000771 /TAXON_ID=215587 /ORGANISM="Aplanochytrium stocchinoi, Strain GSBS06" /LENGTH=158 /DNA_ID=CAMNT_0051972771 /DNA_START=400 /DNA_END=876 /DNA_ORIENTATION=-